MGALATLLATVLVAPTFVLSAIPLSSIPRISNELVVPGAYIIQLQDTNQSAKRSLSVPDEFFHSLTKRAVSWQPRQRWVDPFITGVSIQLDPNENLNDVLAQVADIKNVIDITPVHLLQAPKPPYQQSVTGFNDANVNDTTSSHIMTGIDKLHAEGILGRGINIAIIDSGVDYNHPSLGGGFGPGFKVARGYDFVGDTYTGHNDGTVPQPDNDPMDCFGHGTHVAGIVGADDNNIFNISGAAPEATLSAYRVFGCSASSSAPDDIVINALLRAYHDGNDILTLSLGSSSGWTESVTSVVASRIAASGRVVTVAAGNDGALGGWLTSAPGTGLEVINVGSVDNIGITIQNATLSNGHDPIPYFSLFPLPILGSLPIYATSTSVITPNDACQPLPSSTPNLSGFLVVVQRGGCALAQKIANIVAKGAKQALIYNNGAAWAPINVGQFPAALISENDGAYLVSQFVANSGVKITFPQSGASYISPDPHGGLVSTFSSYGLTYDMYAKPNLMGVGGNVLSTLPLNQGGWGTRSGTSMSTPLVAGGAALILQVKGKSQSTVRGIRSLLQTTARSVPSSRVDGDPLQTVAQQGAGLIDVFNAIHYKTIVSPSELLLNDTSHHRGFHTISIRNTRSQAVKYTLSHVPAGTAATMPSNNILPLLGPLPLTNAAADIIFSQTTVTVPPGSVRFIFAYIQPPSGLDETTFPIYSGFIKIASDTAEKLSVFYTGVASKMRDMQVIDDTAHFFGVPLPTLVTPVGAPQTGPTNYSFAGSDFPTILWRRAAGSSLVRFDLVDSLFDLTSILNLQDAGEPAVKRRGFFDFFSDVFSWWPYGSNTPHGNIDKVPILGTLYSASYQPRHIDSQDAAPLAYQTIGLFNGTFANSTLIPNNRQYRILLRALKISGNKFKQRDYETWVSPIFGVNRP